ncbi:MULTISPECIES: hypothetical protein [Cysteiniphilum]|uniref:Uncharacterized protein n=1 Tax=Cysteiniphilum litorale TaxID=2056700 RepID=A0A8J3E885_9GAMM|nr:MULTISPECIES: hypothetical protein [Cysteiniphilum]GGF92036.1 hypothetical protein GCM10010995_06510 [Cysteiniphilum litorale]
MVAKTSFAILTLNAPQTLLNLKDISVSHERENEKNSVQNSRIKSGNSGSVALIEARNNSAANFIERTNDLVTKFYKHRLEDAQKPILDCDIFAFVNNSMAQSCQLLTDSSMQTKQYLEAYSYESGDKLSYAQYIEQAYNNIVKNKKDDSEDLLQRDSYILNKLPMINTKVVDTSQGIENYVQTERNNVISLFIHQLIQSVVMGVQQTNSTLANMPNSNDIARIMGVTGDNKKNYTADQVKRQKLLMEIKKLEVYFRAYQNLLNANHAKAIQIADNIQGSISSK